MRARKVLEWLAFVVCVSATIFATWAHSQRVDDLREAWAKYDELKLRLTAIAKNRDEWRKSAELRHEAFLHCIDELEERSRKPCPVECPNAIFEHQYGSHVGMGGVECDNPSDIVWCEGVEHDRTHFLGHHCSVRWMCGGRPLDERDMQ